uniref:Uncharacterized protein n=1 Tax=Physcomitrium patens TaxID=3218 RepID=A0A2K1JP73_PHYPA|nr:hypothetical protein PHYPA_015739 [Physcomitrium patens]
MLLPHCSGRAWSYVSCYCYCCYYLLPALPQRLSFSSSSLSEREERETSLSSAAPTHYGKISFPLFNWASKPSSSATPTGLALISQSRGCCERTCLKGDIFEGPQLWCVWYAWEGKAGQLALPHTYSCIKRTSSSIFQHKLQR